MNVGVLRGGISHEYDVSLKTGGEVLRNLPEHCKPRDVLIMRDGSWHLDGLPIYPHELPKHVDIAVNALHGHFGEDGQVQRLLENIGLPYTGSRHFAASTTFNKAAAKNILSQAGIKVPRAYALTAGEEIGPKAKEIFSAFCPPWIIKPADNGSSIGISLARGIVELINGIEEAFRYSDTVLVEEYIRGREVVLGVMDNYRSQDTYVLLPVEVRKPRIGVLGYAHKYADEPPYLSAPTLNSEEKSRLEQTAREAYRSLGLRHYATIDCIVTPNHVYVLEANSLPGLTPSSPFPQALQTVGCSQREFLGHVINQALGR
ncbi:MAG TPA: ATP-grasp domain-containing protein [Candidatus Paceibacterota bacterium]|nr:ATP-grasp domain-containing protein [Candidatus Paceibacterota bacterium]